MKYFFFVALLLICSTNLRAEEFVAKHGSYEINGKKDKIETVEI